MKTLVYSIHGFDKKFLEKASRNKHELEFTEKRLNIETAYLAEGFEAVALFSSDDASSKVIEKLYKYGVKYVALRSVGYDHVDMNVANALGLRVANVPAYSPYSIAEHSVALLLAVNRKIVYAQDLMRQNDFRLDELIGFDLFGKTIGIVGTGKIGAAFASIMNGFGCKILAYDIEENEALAKQFDIRYTTLEELCALSDVISVYCPLNEATKYMFNKTLFSKMKKGVVFINTARGAVVNTIDLIEALEDGIVAAAGLDVYEYEKSIFFYDHSGTEILDPIFERLRSLPNVLITGHQAFLTTEALRGIAGVTIENLDEWELNGRSKNELN